MMRAKQACYCIQNARLTRTILTRENNETMRLPAIIGEIQFQIAENWMIFKLYALD